MDHSQHKEHNSKVSKNHTSPHVHYKNIADDAVTLRVFDMIEQNPQVSQAKITHHTGLAAGLVHSYMKKVISKGWIKANQVSAKRWLYFMTPEGFLEKSRLTKSYLFRAFQSYRDTQKIVVDEIAKWQENGWKNLLIAGDNEFSEIVSLNIKASDDLNLVGIVSLEGKAENINGHAIESYETIASTEYDKLVICDGSFWQWHEQNKEAVSKDKVINLMNSVTSFIVGT